MMFTTITALLALLISATAHPQQAAPSATPTIQGARPHVRAAADSVQSAWAGPIVYSTPDKPITSVTGQLHVPSCYGSENMGSGPFYQVVTWVGIDGTSGTPGEGLLQGGVYCYYNMTTGEEGQFAFVEYYPATLVLLDFPVDDGQDLTITVKKLSDTSGSIEMSNYENGAQFTTTMTAPNPSATLPGKSAEWVVERLPGGDGPLPFAGFASALWASNLATCADGSTMIGDMNNVLDLTDDYGNVVTRTAFDGPGEPRVDFIGQFALKS